MTNAWVNAEESLPGYADRVIGYDSFYYRIGEAELSSSGRLIFIDSDDCNITHWQPFPAPPSEEDMHDNNLVIP